MAYVRTLSRAAWFLSVLWLLSACAPTTELLRDSVEAKPEKPIRSLLVVGVSQDEKMRRVYEQAFIAELQRAGLQGVAGSDLLPSLAGLSMSDLREHMQQFSDRADAVVHVQLANLVQEPALSPQEVPADIAPAATRIGHVDVRLDAAVDPASIKGPAGSQLRVELEATLYALPARRLLWSGLTATHEANDPAQVARSQARALIAIWQRRGYVAVAP